MQRKYPEFTIWCCLGSIFIYYKERQVVEIIDHTIVFIGYDYENFKEIYLTPNCPNYFKSIDDILSYKRAMIDRYII